ncbi:MAG: ATP-dependent DNA helicase RecQ [Salibacteraceae bacterium]
MNKPIDILKKYWGFESFRPLQEDIINHVLHGNDTTALLPTGGGKSICFQVPALCQPGICIVISPLIALMKDQVANLESRGIKALCITSEFDHKQIDAMFDRCIYDKDIRFVYMSPERLKTDIALARIPQMNVSLIAVDEAHCISEWGYDFRPSYLEIASIRSLLPKVPLLALTASATPAVVDDICKRLEFGKKSKVFQKSFQRKNLAYFVDWDEDKFGKAERIARKQKGSGIIYMRSRKGTERIARELKKRGLNIDFYHAGLDNEVRSKKQENWMKGKRQIIAATNAFGMGIDKPDVRFVIHMDIPDTLENYYQECGRAGRDEKKAFAVSLLTDSDVERFKEKSIQNFPSKEEIKRTYASICNYLQLAVGSAEGETFAIDLEKLCNSFELDQRTVLLSIKFLEREGYIQWHEKGELYSSVSVITDNQSLYNLRLKNYGLEPLIEALLRSYSRLFEENTRISEWTLAKRSKWPKDKVVKCLEWLHSAEYIRYTPAGSNPNITFTAERKDSKKLRLSNEHYNLRKEVVQNKAEAMLHFISDSSKCRSRMISEYFGEKNTADCGKCDFCLSL